MNILYIYDGAWPKGATRVRKETRALAAAGHRVRLVARNAEDAPPTHHESWMEVRRLPRVPGQRLRYVLNFPLPVNPLWLFTIWRELRRQRPDLLLVCDLPLAPTAVWFGRAFGIPVHYDMAEVYPVFLQSARDLERRSWLSRLIRHPKFALWAEQYVLTRVNITYVVSEESRSRCLSLGVPQERLVIVGNTPEALPCLEPQPSPPDEIADWVQDGRDIILFVGILIADRGVLDAVRAMPTLHLTRPGATLVIVGDGPERSRLEGEVAALDLKDSVRLVGWKNQDELDTYYLWSHIGILPFLNSPHVRITLANKLFDYMSSALPVLGADLPPIRRVLTETGAGRCHAPNDPGELARQAALLLRDSSARAEMGKAGRRAVETVYSWEHDVQRMLVAVRDAQGAVPA